MSLRIENVLVTDGQRLNNRIITMRSQSVIPTFAFRRTVLKLDANDEEDRRFVTWSGLGTIGDSDEHAIDYERVRRWHLVQDELAAAAKAEQRPFVVTADGLE